MRRNKLWCNALQVIRYSQYLRILAVKEDGADPEPAISSSESFLGDYLQPP